MQPWPEMRLCCTNPVRDSSRNFSVVAGLHVRIHTPDLQDQELARLQWSARAPRSLTIWIDPAMTWEAAPTGKRGRQPDYGDAAIQTYLTM